MSIASGGSNIRERVAHFFVSVCGSKIRWRVAQNFIDIHNGAVQRVHDDIMLLVATLDALRDGNVAVVLPRRAAAG